MQFHHLTYLADKALQVYSTLRSHLCSTMTVQQSCWYFRICLHVAFVCTVSVVTQTQRTGVHMFPTFPMHVLQVSRPTARGEVEGSGLVGGSPGPQPGGEVEGLGGVSRPTPGGGGSWGVWPWGGVSRPTPRVGVSQHALRQQTATAEGGTHPTGMHSCSIVYLTKFLAVLT